MSKQEEIDCWRNFVANLPANSYLHSMFKGSEGMIENMIRNDFAYDPLPELYRQQQELHEQIKAEKERLKLLQLATNEQQRQHDHIDKCLKALKGEVVKLAQKLIGYTS